jgi:ATP-dependent Clp protease protease subunit
MIRKSSTIAAICVLSLWCSTAYSFLLPPSSVKAISSSSSLKSGKFDNGDPYAPDERQVDEHLGFIAQQERSMGGGIRMMGGGASSRNYPQTYQGARIGPPPDLPSLLLHNRIVYLGMPLVPQVTELIVAELLYLNYESSTKPVYMYINTPGTSTPDGRSVGFETEAFAIADAMKYIKPPVYTVGVGQAFGTGAMLLAQGEKGGRSALPNASIMLHQPRSMARGQASDMAIKAREVMANREVTVQMLSKACGKAYETVEQDASRTFYMSPEEAVEYGLIDKVLTNSKKDKINSGGVKPRFLDSIQLS